MDSKQICGHNDFLDYWFFYISQGAFFSYLLLTLSHLVSVQATSILQKSCQTQLCQYI